MKRYFLILGILAAFGFVACDDSSENSSDNGGVTDDQSQKTDDDKKDDDKKDGDKKDEDKKDDLTDDTTVQPDSDGDTIGDCYEMYSTYYDVAMFGPDEDKEFKDTDNDETPDYLDLDSDGDTIPDSIEALNNGNPGTKPFFGAGMTAAFRSLDSDDNGIPDSLECITGKNLLDTPEVLATSCEDTDGDTIPNFADTDDDNDGIPDEFEIVGLTDFSKVQYDCNGDTIPEVNGTLEAPLDCDGDTIPDFRDEDSDNDGVPDKYEGVDDSNNDGILDMHSPDSDGDTILDKEEFGEGDYPVDTDNDTIPDMKDLDSDDDGLPDELEVECPDGKKSRLYWDTDDDGTSDMAEYVFAKANSLDPATLICDSSKTAKDFVEFYFELPRNAEEEKSDILNFKPLITKADILVNIDHTGSMGTMIKAIQDNFTQVVAPEVQKRVPDTYYGVSHFGDYDATPVWEIIQDMTSDITLFAKKLKTVQALPEKTDGPEAGYESFYRIANGGVSFRKGSLPIILHLTDAEAKTDAQAKSASSSAVTSQEAIDKLNSIGARVIPLYNTFINSEVNKDLLVSDSKSMADRTNARVPVCAFKQSGDKWLCGEGKCCTNATIFDRGNEKKGEEPSADGYCTMAFESDDLTTTKALSGNNINVLAWQTTIGVEALVKYSTYTVSTRVIPEPIDAKDAARDGVDTGCFITRIEAESYQPPAQEPEKSCVPEPDAIDFAGKGYKDAFEHFAVGAATPDSPTSTLSFKVFAKNNDCVKTSEDVRMYYATIEVYDPVTGLIFDSQRVAIIVPGEYIREIVY